MLSALKIPGVCAVLALSISPAAAPSASAATGLPPALDAASAGSAADPLVTALPELSVEAQRIALQRQVQAFVRGLTRNPGHAGSSLVRWNSPVCPFVAGLSPAQNGVVVARLRATVAAAGAPLGASGCHANLVVVIAAQPSKVLNAWYARDSHLFGRAGLLEIRHFMAHSPTVPVSAWYNIDSGPAMNRAPLVHRLSNGQGVPVSAQAEASRLAWNAVLGISSAFEIIDAAAAGQASLEQLGDYAAMSALTNVDLRVDLGGAPSILTLFTAPHDTPAALSRWDAAFLRALYQSDQASRVQRSQIADRVLRELTQ